MLTDAIVWYNHSDLFSPPFLRSYSLFQNYAYPKALCKPTKIVVVVVVNIQFVCLDTDLPISTYLCLIRYFQNTLCS